MNEQAKPIEKVVFDSNSPIIFSTIEESEKNKIEFWRRHPDLMGGLEFCATFQMRTPLRILKRHGELHTDINKSPPKIAAEMWQGIWIWLWNTKTFRQLGIQIDEFEGSIASEIGPVNPADYLPFLIAVRTIVEARESIDVRIGKLHALQLIDKWAGFANAHGGMNQLAERFFPFIVNCIPQIPMTARHHLSDLGLNTANQLAAATDEALLSVRGIGPAKVQVLRCFCAGIIENRDAERLDYVFR